MNTDPDLQHMDPETFLRFVTTAYGDLFHRVHGRDHDTAAELVAWVETAEGATDYIERLHDYHKTRQGPPASMTAIERERHIVAITALIKAAALCAARGGIRVRNEQMAGREIFVEEGDAQFWPDYREQSDILYSKNSMLAAEGEAEKAKRRARETDPDQAEAV